MNHRAARTLVSILLVLVVALASAACGGPSKDDYLAGLKRVKSQLDEANDASQQAASETDAAKRTALLQDAQASIEKAAKTADALDPPDDVKKAHGQLAAALHDYAKVFGELATVKDDDPDRADLYARAGDIVDRLDKANRALEKAGYTVERDKSSK